MHSYNARMFRPLADTYLGKQLWIFLNDDIIVACMKTATYLGKPAVSGIEENLLDKFQTESSGRSCQADDWPHGSPNHGSQWLHSGKAKRDYRLHTVLEGYPLYPARNGLQLHVFSSSKNRYELCFTTTRDTTALPNPENNGKWPVLGFVFVHSAWTYYLRDKY